MIAERNRAATTRRREWRGIRELVAVAFLLQLLLWSFYAPAMAVGIVTPICGAAGLTLVKLDADGRPLGSGEADADKSTNGQDDGPCPLRQLVEGAGAPPSPSVAVAPVVNFTFQQPIPAPQRPIIPGWFLSTLQARAPPGLQQRR